MAAPAGRKRKDNESRYSKQQIQQAGPSAFVAAPTSGRDSGNHSGSGDSPGFKNRAARTLSSAICDAVEIGMGVDLAGTVEAEAKSNEAAIDAEIEAMDAAIRERAAEEAAETERGRLYDELFLKGWGIAIDETPGTRKEGEQ